MDTLRTKGAALAQQMIFLRKKDAAVQEAKAAEKREKAAVQEKETLLLKEKTGKFTDLKLHVCSMNIVCNSVYVSAWRFVFSRSHVACSERKHSSGVHVRS